jgi:mRNA interferase RelE/StbE
MTKYQVQYDRHSEKQIDKLDPQTRRVILSWVGRRLVNCTNPRQYGKALNGKLKGLWRYRVGVYRLVARISDQTITILILNVGHRREVYRG